jgi:hypothetical protein
MAEERWARIEEVWDEFLARTWRGTAGERADRYVAGGMHADLVLCALASISKSLREVLEALKHRRLLDERALIPAARELGERRFRTLRWIEEFVRKQEELRGPLDEKTRADYVAWLTRQNEWFGYGFNEEPEVTYERYGQTHGHVRDGRYIEGKLDTYVHFCVPRSWSKRSKRYKAFKAWMKRRPKCKKSTP